MQELIWKDIAVRLKNLRNKSKLTIERLAEIIGVSPSFIGLSAAKQVYQLKIYISYRRSLVVLLIT